MILFLISFERSNNQLLAYWKDYVLGLDWVGDEYGFPYCAFVHRDFIGNDGIVMKMREYHPKFGIRIHCGESVPMPIPGPGNEAFETHLEITFNAIRRIQSSIKSNLRLGHAVAFLQKNSQMASGICNFITSQQSKIYCELNMTSNEYLLPCSSYNGKELALPLFIKSGIPVVLCTDDDGIWPIDKCSIHRRHISVGASSAKLLGYLMNLPKP